MSARVLQDYYKRSFGIFQLFSENIVSLNYIYSDSVVGEVGKVRLES